MADTIAPPQSNSDDFLNYLRSDFTNLPSTQQAANEVTSLESFQPRRSISQEIKEGEKAYVREHEQPGVPLDMESEIGGLLRLRLAFQNNLQKEVEVLNQKYPGLVRVTKDNQVFVTVKDEQTGKAKDIAVDSPNITLQDLKDLSGAIPSMAGYAVGSVMFKKVPGLSRFLAPTKTAEGGKISNKVIRNTLAEAAGGAAGAATAGAVQDVAVDVAEGRDISSDFESIIEERKKQAAYDFALGVVQKPVGAFFKWIQHPMAGSRGRIEYEGAEGRAYLNSKFGTKYEPSIGEKTGSVLATRMEKQTEIQPAGAGPLREFAAKQQGELDKLDAVIRGTALETDEQVGQRAVNYFRSIAERGMQAVQGLAETVKRKAMGEVDDIIRKSSKDVPELNPVTVGEAIRTKIVGNPDLGIAGLKREARDRVQKLYADAALEPGGTGKVFDGGPLVKEAEKILKELPSVEVTTTVPTGLISPTGTPITRSQTGEEILKAWLPAGIKSRLEEIVALKGQKPKFSMSDIQQLRTDIQDSIEKGSGLPDQGVRYLSQIHDSLTKYLENQMASVPNSNLLTLWKQANEAWKKEVVPFGRKGISELFVKPTEGGSFLFGSDIVKAITSKPEMWDMYKQVLGPSSPEFIALKRNVLDTALENARLPDGSLDASAVRQSINKFITGQPHIAEDIFGKRGARSVIKDLFEYTVQARYAAGDKISESELRQLLASGTARKTDFDALVKSEKLLDQQYKTRVMQWTKEGVPDTASIKPSEFVVRFVRESEPSEVKEVVGLLSKERPGLLEDVQQKTIEWVLDSAKRTKTRAGMEVAETYGPALQSALKDKATSEKLKNLLTPEQLTDLDQYAKVLVARSKKETAYGTAGGIQAGMAVSGMSDISQQGLLSTGKRWLENWIVSNLLVRKSVRSLLGSVPEDTGKGVGRRGFELSAMLLSEALRNPEISRAAVAEFGPEGADAIYRTLKANIDKHVLKNNWISETLNQQNQPPQPPVTKSQEFQDYLRQ